MIWSNPPPDITPFIGFIYKIQSPSLKVFYYGRKNFYSKITKPPLKGRVNKRRSKVESSWTTYTSSSIELNQLIDKHGIDSFNFEIIRCCKTLSEMSYYEAYYIINSMLHHGSLNKNVGRVPCKPKIIT